MRTNGLLFAGVVAVFQTALPWASAGPPAGTAFTYQGQLRQDGVPANGSFDLRFVLTDVNGATQGVRCVEDVSVVNGLFSAQLDFAGLGSTPVFGPDARELAVFVRPGAVTGACAAGVNYTPLTPRQPITATPYASTALNLSLPFSGTSPQSSPAFEVIYGSPDPGSAIVGRANNPNGTFIVGVHGLSEGAGGTGVIGESIGHACDFFQCIGVYGKSDGTFASGVRGEADHGVGGEFRGSTALSALGGSVGLYVSASGTAIAADSFDGYAARFRGQVKMTESGIGTSDSIALLQVVTHTKNATDNTAVFEAPEIGPNKSHIHYGTTGDWYIRSAASGGKVVMQDTGGGVGIGATTPDSFKLAVNGDAAKPGGGDWSVFCDSRLKRDIEPLRGTLERLLSLHGYTFEYKPAAIENRLAMPGRQIGLLAEEVEQVFPDWVDTDEEGYKYVTERATTALLVEALRELRAEKDTEIAQLRERLGKIESALGTAAGNEATKHRP